MPVILLINYKILQGEFGIANRMKQMKMYKKFYKLPVTNNRIRWSLVSVSATFLLTTATKNIWCFRTKIIDLVQDIQMLAVDWTQSQGSSSSLLISARLALIGPLTDTRPRDDQSDHAASKSCYLQITSCVRRTLCISGFLIWLDPSYSTTCLVAESISLTYISCSCLTPAKNIKVKIKKNYL